MPSLIPLPLAAGSVGAIAADVAGGASSSNVALTVGVLGFLGTVVAYFSSRRGGKDSGDSLAAAVREERDRIIKERDDARKEIDRLQREMEDMRRMLPVDMTRRPPRRARP